MTSGGLARRKDIAAARRIHALTRDQKDINSKVRVILSKRVAHSQPAHTFCCRTQKPCSIQKRRTGWWIKKSVLNDKCMGTEYMHTHPHHPHAIVHTVHFFEQEPLCSIRLPIHLRVNSSALLPHTEHKSPGFVRLPIHLRVFD